MYINFRAKNVNGTLGCITEVEQQKRGGDSFTFHQKDYVLF